jgi:hypothetical protein
MDVFINLALPWLLIIAVIGCAGGIPLLFAHRYRDRDRTAHRTDQGASPGKETADRTC